MHKTQLFLGIGGIVLIIAACAGSFVAASHFYDAQPVVVPVAEVRPVEEDTLFKPIISSKGYSCVLDPADAGRSVKQVYFSIESDDPQATADAILAISKKISGATIAMSSSSYNDNIPVNTSNYLYLQGAVPSEQAEQVMAEIEKLHKGATYISSRNATSWTAQQALDDCQHSLVNIQGLELKEAAYLTQLKQGGVDQAEIEAFVNQLLYARNEYVSTLRYGSLDVKRRLNFTEFSINISLAKG
jgi:hypothetical protein